MKEIYVVTGNYGVVDRRDMERIEGTTFNSIEDVRSSLGNSNEISFWTLSDFMTNLNDYDPTDESFIYDVNEDFICYVFIDEDESENGCGDKCGCNEDDTDNFNKDYLIEITKLNSNFKERFNAIKEKIIEEAEKGNYVLELPVSEYSLDVAIELHERNIKTYCDFTNDKFTIIWR